MTLVVSWAQTRLRERRSAAEAAAAATQEALAHLRETAENNRNAIAELRGLVSGFVPGAREEMRTRKESSR